ncbi:MAG: ADP-ribosylglycohydrolase family protein [Actinobacteria bacterium]|nr:ADP-ribosylglycohydrolase family protein [Actinomycetota bacterium]
MKTNDSFTDKFIGTLLGCAIGDALGAPVEGLPSTEIKSRYGTVNEYLDERFGRGRITDDTQMTIVLSQALIEAGRFEPDHTARKFGHWMELSDKGIKEARGVGQACGTACRRLYEGASLQESGVCSAGCGAAMRVSPIGLRYCGDLDELKRAAVEQAHITHTDPEGIAGAVAVARAVACGINNKGKANPAAIAICISEFIRPFSTRMSEKINGLTKYLELEDELGFAYTGNSGYVMETVPCALYSFLKTPDDFETTVIRAVNAGGDTDSIGAIAGAISGSFNGTGNIPHDFLEPLEGREYLKTLAVKLSTLIPKDRPRDYRII